MPYPKLSSVLNNCAVHSLTPEICAQVSEYARDPHYNNQHNPEYLRLKAVFAEFYGFERDSFTWKEFSDTLNFYNGFDRQLVLGPVLRSFMKGSMITDSTRAESFIPILAELAQPPLSAEGYINSHTETSDQEQGRYPHMAPDQLAQYVGIPLGLNIRYYPQVGDIRNFPAENEVALVEIYHSGAAEGPDGHWERVPDTTSEDCIDYQQQPDTKLTCLLPLFGQRQVMSECGIKLLRDHVALVASGADVPDVIHLTSAQITKYIYAINIVPKALAIKLLGELTEDTRHFIASYPIATPAFPMQIYENYIRTLKTCKPQITAHEKHTVEQLLAGLSPQEIKELADSAFFASLGEVARARVATTMNSIQSMRIDFSTVDGDSIDEHAGILRDELIRRFNSPRDDLRILGKSLGNYPQLTTARDLKITEIEQAALRRKRELLLIEIGFDAYLLRFGEHAIEIEENAEEEPDLGQAAEAARAFVIAITRAKDRFLEAKNKPIEESKRAFKDACEAAVAEARPFLAEHHGWLMTAARFLCGVVASLSLRVTGNRWTMFNQTPAETLAAFETELVNNKMLLPNLG